MQCFASLPLGFGYAAEYDFVSVLSLEHMNSGQHRWILNTFSGLSTIIQIRKLNIHCPTKAKHIG